MSVRIRNKYSDEFKKDAVELASRVGLHNAARELGLNPTNIRRWKETKELPELKQENELERENRRLKKENHYLKEINKVLKKSTAIFSQENFPDFH